MSNKPRIITGNGPLILPKQMPGGGDECVELLESMLEAVDLGEGQGAVKPQFGDSA